MPIHRDNAAGAVPTSSEEDAIVAALAQAPVDDEPESEQERLAVAEARAELVRGETVSSAEIRRIISQTSDHS